MQGALANLGHRVAPSTVANILRKHGIEPAPERKRQTTWRTFLKAHWDCLGAIGFTTIEVWTKGGFTQPARIRSSQGCRTKLIVPSRVRPKFRGVIEGK